jgi:hypothetical protein
MAESRETTRTARSAGPKLGPRFSQAAIEALRREPSFEQWTNNFEKLKSKIGRRVSPRDIRPLLKAGATKEQLLERLAFVVYHAKNSPFSNLMKKREALRSLAAQLSTVVEHTTRLVSDPECDGRYWWALVSGLSWDLVPQAGLIEAQTLRRMRALAQLVKSRGDALGKLSRHLKRVHFIQARLDLLAYVWLSTKREDGNFDTEIAYLLSAAFKAVGEEKHFTAEQISKTRQRRLPNRNNPKI